MTDEVSPGGSLAQLVRKLKNERLNRQLSIEEMSQIVNFSAAHIEKVEAGDFTFLPPLYVFSFLRKYAAELGVGDEQLLAQCRNELNAPDRPSLQYDAAAPTESDRASSLSSILPTGNWKSWAVLAVLLILAAVLLFSLAR